MVWVSPGSLRLLRTRVPRAHAPWAWVSGKTGRSPGRTSASRLTGILDGSSVMACSTIWKSPDVTRRVVAHERNDYAPARSTPGGAPSRTRTENLEVKSFLL